MIPAPTSRETTEAAWTARSYPLRFIIVLCVTLLAVQLGHGGIRPELVHSLGLVLGIGACLVALHPTQGTLFHALLGAGIILTNLSALVPHEGVDWVRWLGFVLIGASGVVIWRRRATPGADH